MSILSQSFNIIIERGISAPGHGREVVDGLNDTENSFIFHIMSNFQLSGRQRFDTQIAVYTATQNTDVRFARDFQKHLSIESHKHRIKDHGKHKQKVK